MLQVISLVTYKFDRKETPENVFKPLYAYCAFRSLKALIKVNVIVFHGVCDPGRNACCNFLVCLSAYNIVISQASILPEYGVASLVIGVQH